MSEKALKEGDKLPAAQPGLMRIYSMKYCPFAQRTRLVLKAKNIPFETVNINLSSKPKWFSDRNPFARVPVLEKDGEIVYESLVCNDYLDKTYPGQLNPSDPYRKARDMMLMERNSQFVTNFYKVVRTMGKDEDALKEYFSAPGPFEEELGRTGNYFGGEKPGMLDYNLWPYYERLDVVFSLVEGLEAQFKEKYPRVTDWVKRMLDDPAVKAIWNPVKKHLAFYESYRSGTTNYDV